MEEEEEEEEQEEEEQEQEEEEEEKEEEEEADPAEAACLACREGLALTTVASQHSWPQGRTRSICSAATAAGWATTACLTV